MYLNVVLPFVSVFTTPPLTPPIKAFTARPIAGACSLPCRLIAEQNPHTETPVKAAEGTAAAAAALTGVPGADTMPHQMQGVEYRMVQIKASKKAPAALLLTAGAFIIDHLLLIT